MKHFFTILGHEVRMLLVSPSTYVAIVLFLAVMGFFFSATLDSFSMSPQATSPAFFFFHFCFVPVLFMVPLLTMKCLAEERRQGTIETLLTTPVTTTEVVLGKYAAAYLLYLALWASTGGFFAILMRFAGDERFLDYGPLIGGYAFVAISGLLFVAIGVFASAMSKNQAVAWILAFSMLFALIVGPGYLSEAPFLQGEIFDPVQIVLGTMQVSSHLNDFSRGIIDTRQILFYLSGTTLALIFSVLSVEVKILHS